MTQHRIKVFVKILKELIKALDPLYELALTINTHNKVDIDSLYKLPWVPFMP